MFVPIEFDPIDNQKYADLAGVSFDTVLSDKGPVVYGITHFAWNKLNTIRHLGPCILITSFSDAPLIAKHARRLPHNVVKWYSNNVMTDHPKVEALPIGFCFKRDHQDLCVKLSKEPRPPEKNLAYMNFLRNIPRSPNPREGVYEQFGGKDWITTEGGMPDSYLPIEEFYHGIRSHPFVISPPGAGLDCHRHWEAMAMGSIPIVLRSKAVELLEDMPALIIDCWDEVTQERLEAELPGLRERFAWDSMTKLDMNFWRRRIQNAIDLL